MKASKRALCALAIVLCLVGAVCTSASATQALVLANDAKAAADALGRAGAQVGHVFPPHVLFANASDPAALAKVPGIISVTTQPVQPEAYAAWGETAALAADVWNQGLSPRAAALTSRPEPGPIQGDMRELPEYLAVSRALSGLAAAPPYGAATLDTSAYMVGKVAVGIVLPESTGSGENWTSGRQSSVVAQIQQAMAWWVAREPNAHLTFYYDIHLSVSTTYEPIQLASTDEGLWIAQTLSNMGYGSGDYFNRAYSYDNAIRNSLGTDWAFTIFVVDSYDDSDGCFTDDYFAYAYLGGPFEVMTYDNDGYGISNMAVVSAHETAHIFYALDEYAGASSPSETSGYYNAVNGNYVVGGITNVACIMRGQVSPYTSGAVCSYTHQHIGHRDLNSNGIEDVVDVPPETTMATYSPNPTTQTTLTFTGSATVVPLTNQNPKGPYQPPHNITINTIAGVDYQVDGGAWQPATASDGAFDEPQENYTFSVSLGSGTHLIAARARDTAPNVDPTPASQSVTVQPGTLQVLSTSPVSGVTGVSPSAVLTATFNQPMLASSINTGTFIAREGASNWLSGTVTYDDGSRTATFTPAATLPAGGVITATLISGSSGVQSASGAHLSNDYVWSFTAAQPVAILPTGSVTPASGALTTTFTWRVEYTNSQNAAPDEIWVALSSPAGGVSWRGMSAEDPSDTTYTDGAWFTYSSTLSGGEWAFRFAARAGADWVYWPQPTGSYVAGPSVNPVVLSSGYLTPSSGTTSTQFTWRVKYWNTRNAAPTAVWAAIWWQSAGKAYWYKMWPLDPGNTNYAGGVWYTLSMRGLDTSGHAVRFAAQQGSYWAYYPQPTGTYIIGPTVGP